MNKKGAIRNALGRLGWHASGKDVVALLANFGVEVSPGLVHKVRIEALKDSGRLRQLRIQAPLGGRPLTIPRAKKVPDRR